MPGGLVPELTSRLGLLREAAHASPLGLYLHIPFCIDRCSYCSFASTRDHTRKPAAVEKLGGDLAIWGEALGHPSLDTLYLGGGTPSLLSGPELAGLTMRIREAFETSDLCEATLEANPGTLSPAWLEEARMLGWDRISLGVQTLDAALLRSLGRIHDPAQALEALRMARAAGFRRISCDLMIGIPGQDPARAIRDARVLVEAGASHLSIYMLDLDKACPLKRQVEEGLVTLPDEDTVADAFEALQAGLPALGLLPYEISNYAVEGEQSRHNTRYWQRRPYLGLGPSAASHLGPWRWSEPSGLPAWLSGQELGEFQTLDAAAELAEVPLLGLRMLCGVDWEALRRLGERQELSRLVAGWEAALEPFFRHGLLEREGAVVRFTRRGLLLSNAVLETFI